jgi:hypothetical protein
MAEAISVADMIGALGKASVDVSTRESGVQAAYSQMEQTKQDNAKILNSAAMEVTAAAGAQAIGATQQQARDAKTLQVIDYDNLLSEGVAKINKAFSDREQAAATIKQKESVGFFDNPFDYIINQATLDKDYAAYNAADDEIQANVAHVRDLNALAQENMQTSSAAMAGLKEATAAATIKAQGAQLTVAANQQILDGQIYGIQALDSMTKANAQQIEYLMKARQVQEQQENQDLRREQMLQAQSARRLSDAQREALNQDKLDNIKARADYLDTINTGRKQLGQAPFTSWEQVKLQQGTKNGAELLQKMYDVGYDAKDKAASGSTAPVVIGTDAAQVAELLVKGNGRLPETQSKVSKLITGAYSDVVNSTDPTMDKKPESIHAFTNQKIANAMTIFSADVMRDRENNPYSPLNMNTVAQIAANSVGVDPVYKKLFATEVAAAPTKETNPQEMFNRVAGAVLSKDANTAITYEQGVEFITKYFNAAAEANNVLQGFSGKGLPNQASFKTAISVSPDNAILTGTKSVDLTNRTQVGAIINKMLAHQLLLKQAMPLHAGSSDAADIVNRLKSGGY